jgi:hypothetical protein
MMLQLDFGGTSGEVTSDERSILRAQFASHGGIRLPGLLAPGVIGYVNQRCGPAAFMPRDLGPLGIQLRCIDATLETAVMLAMNRAPLLELLEGVTARSPIRSIGGHIARLAPDSNQQLTWHDDGNEDDRVLGLSVHLSNEAYRGGLFQLRTKHDRETCWEMANTGCGDAIVFTVNPAFEHRVTPVTGVAARTVFAGWAMKSPPRPGVRVTAGA